MILIINYLHNKLNLKVRLVNLKFPMNTASIIKLIYYQDFVAEINFIQVYLKQQHLRLI